jgi:hypothetical protein
MAVAQVYWEEDGKERESESNERERRKRGGVASRGCSRGVFSASRRQAGGGARRPCTGHAGATYRKKKKGVILLQKTP